MTRQDTSDDRLPTSTAHQARLQLFQPTRRPEFVHRVVQTSWGEAVVSGKLGQGHADFVEAVLRSNTHWEFVGQEPKRRLKVGCDPYRVRLSMGGGKKASHDQMMTVARELRSTSIDLRYTDAAGTKRHTVGGIVDDVDYSDKRVANPLGGDRALLEVTFNAAFVKLLDGDLRLYHDPTPYARLRTGIAQAVARFIITHRTTPNGGFKLETLLDAVGVGASAQARKDRRRELRSDAEQLAELGILLDGDRVFSEKRRADVPWDGAERRRPQRSRV